MAEIKDKIVTIESLSALHEHNKDSYMSIVNPVGIGDASFSGSVTIGSNIKLVNTGTGLDIIFLEDE